MTLRRRLLVLLLISVPVVWTIAVGASYLRSRHEINEYFDTQQIRFAQLVLSMLPSANLGESPVLPPVSGALGEAELKDLSVAVWSADGRLLLTDQEGATLPFRQDAPGFVDIDSVASAGVSIICARRAAAGASPSGRAWRSATRCSPACWQGSYCRGR